MASTHSKEITTLLWFRLSEDLNDEPLTIGIEKLLNEEDTNQYLSEVMVGIGAPNEKVAASMLVKRYAFLSVMALFMMSQSDRRLNVDPSNLTLVSHYDGDHWLPKFYLKDLTFEALTGDRQNWREQYMSDIFANHLNILIELLAKQTKISKLILWENVAVYLFWLYETVLINEVKRKELIDDDFYYLFHEAPGHVFGSYHHNPLTKYVSEKIYHAETDKYIRTRKTCCFAYLLKGSKDRCNTCPCFSLDEEGRCRSEQSICSTIRSINE